MQLFKTQFFQMLSEIKNTEGSILKFKLWVYVGVMGL